MFHELKSWSFKSNYTAICFDVSIEKKLLLCVCVWGGGGGGGGQIMHRTGNTPESYPLVVQLLMHESIAWPHCVKTVAFRRKNW